MKVYVITKTARWDWYSNPELVKVFKKKADAEQFIHNSEDPHIYDIEETEGEGF